MKLIIKQGDLAAAVSKARRGTGTRPVYPINANALLSATSDNRLQVSGTNDGIAITCTIDAEVEKAGAITVQAKLLDELINQMTPGSVYLAINDHGELSVRSQRLSSTLKTVSADHFPSLSDDVAPCPSVAQQFTLPATQFKRSVQQVAFCASKDTGRIALTAISLTVHGNQMIMASTDGHRISEQRQMITGGPENKVDVLIPAKALLLFDTITRTCNSKSITTITIPHDHSKISFRLDGLDEKGATLDILFCAPLSAAKFPPYQQIIPTSRDTCVEVDRLELLQRLKTAKLFAEEGTWIVTLKIDPIGNEFVILAENKEQGSSTMQLDATMGGAPVTPCFNVNYLIEVLGHLYTDRVLLEFTTATRPLAMMPVGQREGESYLHVMMPMHRPETE